MPFVSNMDNEEQKTDPNAAPQQGAVSPTGGGGAVRLSPSAAVPTVGGGGTAGNAPSGNPSPAGGQFGSLNQYLSANQGQAAPLAGKLTPSIGKEYSSLDTQNNAAIANINNQVANAPGYTPSNPSVMAAEAANPVSFTSNPNNVKQFQSLLNNTYSGPASAESTADYANQQSAINSAIATGKANTTTEAGRENLLSKNEAAPTTGVTALNSAILSQDPNALSSVENAYKPFNNLLTGLQSNAQTTNAQIVKEQADAASSAKAAQDAITSQSAALNQDVTNATTAAQKNAAAQEALVGGAFQNLYSAPLDTTATTLGTYGGGSTPWGNTTNYSVNALSPEATAALGMTPDQAAQLQQALTRAATSQFEAGHNFGAGSTTTQVDLSPYLTQVNPAQDITTANVATPEQYAKEQAFQTLLGQLPTGSVLNPGQATQAGLAPKTPITFDYNAALQNANQTADAERAAAQAEASGLTSAADLAHAQSQHGGGILGALGKAAQVVLPVNYLANKMAIPVAQNIGKTVKKGMAHGGITVSDKPFQQLLSNFSTGVK